MPNASWDLYFSLLRGLTVATAFIILISTLDDFFIDACYWGRRWVQAVVRCRRPVKVSADDLRARDEGFLAIMVPAWKEYSVIAHMVENTLTTVEYQNYVIFIGAYLNDAETTAEVDHMARRHPGRVRRATVPHPGPTCKADCLNWIVREISDYEATHGMQFAGVILHDCEDVIHPLELKYFNRGLDSHDLIQMPVLSLDLPWHALVAGTYMDDFSESHQKDLPVREALTGLVPGAGVALCYGRRAIQAMMAAHDGRPFNTDTLTEDYDFSFRLAALGMKTTFVGQPIQGAAGSLGSWWQRPATATGLLATREYFPKTFRAAYRQRARWLLGIAFLGWMHLGWRGSALTRYMFFRDRKGILTALFTAVAYVLLVQVLVLAVLQAYGLELPPGAAGRVVPDWLRPVLLVNSALLLNRLIQRVYFVTRLNGLQHGLMSLPRSVVNNFINFLAVCRAWKIFLGFLVTRESIAWDKTVHIYPAAAPSPLGRSLIGDMLVRFGTITPGQLDQALARQRVTGLRLGQVLVADHLVSVEALADAIAEQAEVPRVNLTGIPLGAIADCLPRHLIVRHEVVPFSTGEDSALNVAVASVPSPTATQEISAAAGRKIAYFIACDHEVDAGVAQLARSMAIGLEAESSLAVREEPARLESTP